MSKHRKKPGIRKSVAYTVRIFPVESDLFAAIEAYGADFCHLLIDLIRDYDQSALNLPQIVADWQKAKRSYGLNAHKWWNDYYGDNETLFN